MKHPLIHKPEQEFFKPMSKRELIKRWDIGDLVWGEMEAFIENEKKKAISLMEKRTWRYEDFYMLPLLLEALKSYELKKCFTTRGRAIYKENRNRFHPLGQIRLMEDRIREIMEAIDKEIKEELKNPR